MLKKFLRKVFGPLFLSVMCGLVCGKLVYQVYDKDIDKDMMGKKIYLIQAGAYSSYDNMVDNTLVSSYVYYEDEDGLYKSIVGITLNRNNIDKIRDTYGNDVIVSEYYSKDEEVNKKIQEYDLKLEKTNDKKEIQSTVLEMLNLYKDSDNSTLVKIKS